MPELPEVETVVRTLRPHVVGRRITSFELISLRAAPAGLGSLITGQTISAVHRHGKHILIDLDDLRLDVHLRMTGKLLVSGPSTHPRAIIHTTGSTIVFDDVRQFGHIRRMELGQLPSNLGPDFLSLTAAAFARLIGHRDSVIKSILLNQSVVAGLGNIYADEALFRCRLHPLTRPAHLSRSSLCLFYTLTVKMLREAIAAGGSTISDYVDAAGRRGLFQLHHSVYRRTDLPCPVCSTAIRRIRVAQRSTHFCPNCQRLGSVGH